MRPNRRKPRLMPGALGLWPASVLVLGGVIRGVAFSASTCPVGAGVGIAVGVAVAPDEGDRAALVVADTDIRERNVARVRDAIAIADRSATGGQAGWIGGLDDVDAGLRRDVDRGRVFDVPSLVAACRRRV